MHPEALGPLIGTLLREPEEIYVKLAKGRDIKYLENQVLAMQQIALANILHWLATDPAKVIIHRLVEEAFARTEPDETSEYKEGRLLDFKEVKEKVELFLKKGVSLTADDKLTDDRQRALIKVQRYLDYIVLPLYSNVCAQEDELKMKVANHKRSKMKAWGTY
ncbi:hypothetical protein [Vibrio ichthyoenteri]|nr:hypothetical protein [Vibrio ichthyoenteri]